MARNAILLLVVVFGVITITSTCYIANLYIPKPRQPIWIPDPFKLYNLTDSNVIELKGITNVTVLPNIIAKVLPYVNETENMTIIVYGKCAIANVTLSICGVAVPETGRIRVCVNNTCIEYVNETHILINGSYYKVNAIYTIEDYRVYLTENGVVIGTGTSNRTFTLQVTCISDKPVYPIVCIGVTVKPEVVSYPPCNMTLVFR